MWSKYQITNLIKVKQYVKSNERFTKNVRFVRRRVNVKYILKDLKGKRVLGRGGIYLCFCPDVIVHLLAIKYLKYVTKYISTFLRCHSIQKILHVQMFPKSKIHFSKLMYFSLIFLKRWTSSSCRTLRKAITVLPLMFCGENLEPG